MPRIEKGLKISDLVRESFQIAGGGCGDGSGGFRCCESDGMGSLPVAFYGSTPSYWPVLEHHGLGDLGRKLNAMTKEGLWDKLAAQISDDTLQLFAAIGRYDQLAGAIKLRFGGCTDMIYSNLSGSKEGALPADLLQDIQNLAMPFENFKKGW